MVKKDTKLKVKTDKEKIKELEHKLTILNKIDTEFLMALYCFVRRNR